MLFDILTALYSSIMIVISWQVALYRTDGLGVLLPGPIVGLFQNVNTSSIEKVEKLKILKMKSSHDVMRGTG